MGCKEEILVLVKTMLGEKVSAPQEVRWPGALGSSDAEFGSVFPVERLDDGCMAVSGKGCSTDSEDGPGLLK